ncbi:MAG: hypothetical protein KAY32_01900 [Candidatus Eisenbacteria sp.]|nr:hypothetical protein [Candidatus Eisenbacteria bacterium]
MRGRLVGGAIRTRHAAGRREVPAGRREVPAGRSEVPAGCREVPAGRSEVSTGRCAWPTGRPAGRLPRKALLGALLLSVSGAFCPQPARAGEIIAEIERIWQKGLYRQDFSLRRDAEIEVEAVGSGSSDMDAMLAYAWILDLRTRRVAWQMDAHRAKPADRKDNLIQRDFRRLPAGDYALYFSAIGGSFPIKKSIKILDFFDIGSVAIRGGNFVRWNEFGTPRDWYAEVRLAAGEPAESAFAEPQDPDLGALLRFDRTRNDSYRTAELRVQEPLVVRILALGEYTAGDHGFADGAWIVDRERCERAWEMSLVNTDHAGGAQKNRVFDEQVRLEPGRYLVCYATDDSHAFDDWNSQPPYDPESWGLTLFPLEPLAPGATEVTLDPPVENEILEIDRVGDAEFRSEVFHVREPVQLCVRALGEWDEKQDCYFDYGWIEELYSLRKVWTMEFNRGRYASGELRNRIVEEAVALDPGDYRVCYVTDEAHSYAGWSKHSPFDPRAWGVRICGLGESFSMDAVDLSVEALEHRAVIRIAPVGNGVHQDVRFKVQEPLAVRIIALGEGQHGTMCDYGWLVDEESGRTVWKMRYEDTRHAGGAKKNRRTERFLELPAGIYRLHYESDDSHAFGRWNEAVPTDPHLWGVTLIEMPPDDR